MHATIDRKGQRVAESSDLEAEVEAWRRKRTRRRISVSCDVTVRIRRHVRPASLSGSSADRPLSPTAG